MKKINLPKKVWWIVGIATLCLVAIILTLIGSMMSADGYFRRRAVSMKTENFTVTDQMMTYYMYNMAQNYQQKYSDTVNIDLEKSLKKQQYTTDKTWYDYFAEQCKTDLRQVLLFCEKATEQGMTITDDERKDIDEYIQTANISLYQKAFGMNKDDLRQMVELQYLYTKMYKKNMDSITVTTGEMDTYYADHQKEFQKIAYRAFAIPYGSSAWYKTAEDAEKIAKDVAKADTEEVFKNNIAYVLGSLGAGADDVTNELQDGLYTDVAYKEGSKFLTWAFDAQRKVYDTFIDSIDGAYIVYQLQTLPLRDNGEQRNVRHILLSAATYYTESGMREKADEILKTFKQNGGTEEAFKKLADEHNEDSSTASTGGLYENVGKGETLDTFDAWTFDASRKAGDTGVITTAYGMHVMYYIGEGLAKWQEDVKSVIVQNKLEAFCKEYEQTWPLTVKNGHIQRLPL